MGLLSWNTIFSEKYWKTMRPIFKCLLMVQGCIRDLSILPQRLFFPDLSLTQNWNFSSGHSVVFLELYAVLRALQFEVVNLPPQYIIIYQTSYLPKTG